MSKILGNYSEAISSVMAKLEMAKYIHLQMWKLFAIWSWKLFEVWIGQIQSKLLYGLVTYGLAGP